MSASIQTTARRRGHAVVELAIVLAATIGIMVLAISSVGTATKNVFSEAGLALQTRVGSDVDNGSTSKEPSDRATIDPTGWRMLAMICFMAVAAIAVLSRMKLGRQSPILHPQEYVLANQICHKTRKRVFAKRDEIMSVLSRQLGLNSYAALQVGQLMSRNVRSVSPDLSAAEVRQLFKELECRHLLVCEGENHLVGIISDRDLRRVAEGTARNLMTPQPICASPDQHLVPIITLMMDRRISCIPVVENKLVVGILTTTDLMIALQCTIRMFHSICEPDSVPAAETTVSSLTPGRAGNEWRGPVPAHGS